GCMSSLTQKSKTGEFCVFPPIGHFVLQWHITERCNRRCAHCYQEGAASDELQFHDLLKVIEQFKDLLSRFNFSVTRHSSARGQINITGGEPFIREDFLDLLEVFHSNRDLFSFAIFTNGSYIDEAMAIRLRKLHPVFVQVSMEGAKETNDSIRGPGAYDQTVVALRHLTKQKVPTLISFTAHKKNYREFAEVARLGRELGVRRVWSDRLIPWGTGTVLRDDVLSPAETREFFEIMYRAHNEAMQAFSGTEVAMHRALQFLVGGGKAYACAAGKSLLAVMPNGDLYPCRRMPIHAGNLMEDSLSDLYRGSDILHKLRNQDFVSKGCEECIFFSRCRGGLRCLSYALTGTPFHADPGCWRARPANHRQPPECRC
ncbi:MAG: radical SAM protein, partial [Nitrospirota bacterium]